MKEQGSAIALVALWLLGWGLSGSLIGAALTASGYLRMPSSWAP
jgi:hypothetical protein